jgi:hypothetical protein
MTREGKHFVYLNSMAGDIIIGGVVKRMLHLAGGGAYAKSYPGQVYLRNLFDSRGEDVWVRGNKYRLRFAQFGHLHSVTSPTSPMECGVRTLGTSSSQIASLLASGSLAIRGCD